MNSRLREVNLDLIPYAESEDGEVNVPQPEVEVQEVEHEEITD